MLSISFPLFISPLLVVSFLSHTDILLGLSVCVPALRVPCKETVHSEGI